MYEASQRSEPEDELGTFLVGGLAPLSLCRHNCQRRLDHMTERDGAQIQQVSSQRKTRGREWNLAAL